MFASWKDLNLFSKIFEINKKKFFETIKPFDQF